MRYDYYDTHDPDELLDVKHLARISHLSERTIRRYITKYNIRAIRHQSGYQGVFKYYVRRIDWEAFLFSKFFDDITHKMGLHQRDHRG